MVKTNSIISPLFSLKLSIIYYYFFIITYLTFYSVYLFFHLERL